MRKNAVCIFAHPDDESFGPSGTIHLLTKEYNVHIICVTRGDAGENHHPDKKTSLETHRKNELTASSKILGVKSVSFLEYEDGELNNNNYHTVAASIQDILDTLRPELVLTFEHRGISGHLDHIAIAMITSYLFEKLSYIKKAMFYCLREDQQLREPGSYFIYFPHGHSPRDIHITNNVESVLDIKRRAIRQHISQTKDMNHILSTLRTEECFYVFEKPVTTRTSE